MNVVNMQLLLLLTDVYFGKEHRGLLQGVGIRRLLAHVLPW